MSQVRWILGCFLLFASGSSWGGSVDGVSALPEPTELPADRLALGQRLFNEKGLSRDGTVACQSCHDLKHGGVDHRPVAQGVGGAVGFKNTPTVFNVGLNFRQFWDGRALNLEEQVEGPLLSPIEMGNTWPKILDFLRQETNYQAAFNAAYAEGLNAENVANALATFERSLVTPRSRFDRFMRGENDILSAPERQGLELFQSLGCISCHQGVNVGGNMFQRFGIMGNFFADRGKDDAGDAGRFNVTGRAEDKHVFKVPSLRNVAETAPYFHDGSVPTLEQAVAIMGRYQLGVSLEPSEIRHLVLFLKTLTGTYQGKPL